MKIVITADGRNLAATTGGQPLTSGSVGIEAAFILSADYDNLAVTAVFSTEETRFDVLLTKSCCIVPWEVLQKPGTTLFVGVVGKNGSGEIVIPTVWGRVGMIECGTVADGLDPEDPTPDIAAQILEQARAALAEAAETKEAAAQSAQDAADDADRAETAKQAVEDLSVTAHEDPDGPSVEKSVNPETGAVTLNFGFKPAGVTEVNGQTGAVSLDLDDIPDGAQYVRPTPAQVQQIGTNKDDIADIEDLIPNQATSQNQLADKDFVNSSINSSAAFFRGAFPTRAALFAVAWQTSDPTGANYVSNNDYAYVADDETHNDEAWRYLYVLQPGGTDNGWQPQFRVNESPLTAAQLAALNSGATAEIIASIADKYVLPAGGMPSADMSDAVRASLQKADTALQAVPDTYRTAAAQDAIDQAQDTEIHDLKSATNYYTEKNYDEDQYITYSEEGVIVTQNSNFITSKRIDIENLKTYYWTSTFYGQTLDPKPQLVFYKVSDDTLLGERNAYGSLQSFSVNYPQPFYMKASFYSADGLSGLAIKDEDENIIWEPEEVGKISISSQDVINHDDGESVYQEIKDIKSELTDIDETLTDIDETVNGEFTVVFDAIPSSGYNTLNSVIPSGTVYSVHYPQVHSLYETYEGQSTGALIRASDSSADVTVTAGGNVNRIYVGTGAPVPSEKMVVTAKTADGLVDKVNNNSVEIEKIKNIQGENELFIGSLRAGDSSKPTMTSLCAVPFYGCTLRFTLLAGITAGIISGISNDMASDAGVTLEDGDTFTFDATHNYYRVYFNSGTPESISDFINEKKIVITYNDAGNIVSEQSSLDSYVKSICYYCAPNNRNEIYSMPIFCHISDTHGDADRMRRCAEYCDWLGGVDAILHSGDAVAWSKYSSRKYIDDIGAECTTPIYPCIGNHEAMLATSQDLYDDMSYLMTKNSVVTDSQTLVPTYYYKDFTNKNIRLITLNQFFADGFHYTQDELNFFISALVNAPSSYGILLMYHSPEGRPTKDNDYASFYRDFGASEGYVQLNNYAHPIEDIIDAFISRTSINNTYTETHNDETRTYTVNANFSSVDSSVEFIAHITGHEHTDMIGYNDGTVNMQLMLNITCGVGILGGLVDLANNGDLGRDGKGSSQDAFNIYAIDRFNKTVRIARVGANISSSMRERQHMIIPYKVT